MHASRIPLIALRWDDGPQKGAIHLPDQLKFQKAKSPPSLPLQPKSAREARRYWCFTIFMIGANNFYPWFGTANACSDRR